jgi:hypothetical protein
MMIPHALTSGVSPVDPSGVYDSQVFALPSGLPSAVHLQMPQQRPFRLSSISEFEGPGPAVMSMHEQPIPQPMMAASFPSMGFSNPFMNPSEGFGVSDAADPQRKRKGLKPAQGAKRLVEFDIFSDSLVEILWERILLRTLKCDGK